MNDRIRSTSNEETTIGGLSVLAGEVTLWGRPGDCQDTKAEVELRLSPSRPVVIGRAEGGMVPYLDPAYVSTTVLPGTGRTILQRQESDLWVSRSHFMLRALGGGILLINGVPGLDGGIRSPPNGTWLLLPADRPMQPGERYVIAAGAKVILRLPNSAELQIRCG